IDTGARGGGVHAASDDDLVGAIARAGDLARAVDALLVEMVGELADRSSSTVREERLTTRMGCRNVTELVQRLTRNGPHTAAKLERAAKATALAWDPVTGAGMPARLPAMRNALLDAETGVDGVLAVAGPLLAMRDRVGVEGVLTADGLLAAAARGEGPDGLPPACADLLRVQAQVWAAVLDPDGAEPDAHAAARRRGITFGTARDGVIPIRGALLPEVAAQLVRIHDATTSPHAVRFHDTESPPAHDVPRDDRTGPQKLHDALAAALTVAAASRDLPTIGGAAPTLIVSIREEDLTASTGRAWLEGSAEPASIFTARHVACAGVIQRVTLAGSGRIVRLGTEERVFNRYQRRAIALRDGGCIIPGCGVPAGWCEIHHVTEHAQGGPTHTDNGVLLCWFHHRFIDTGPWRIRMNHGVPEIQAPHWHDPTQRWRPTTTSRTRLLDLIGRRT
ncbi:HNH endonuclease signature motif containing protein, partial [Microbacterium sp. ASV49]